MKKRVLYFLIPILAFVLVFLWRSVYYYSGFYDSPQVTNSEITPVEKLSEPLSSPLPPPDVEVGTILIDDSHGNGFNEEELTVLFGRITAAGGLVEYYKFGDDLREALRDAGAFVVIANRTMYDANDVLALEEFVRKGGRLLIIGDPLRVYDVNGINSLAGAFGIIYQDDYIYNLVENDGSYLNVIFDDFEENALTENLDRIVFQGAHSLRTGEGALIMGDENTFSSLREKPGDVTAVALTQDDRVLALPDMTFLTGPYNTFADNDVFIDNIVYYLLSSERDFTLLDFPSYFSSSADIVYTDDDLLERTLGEALDLRDALEDTGLVASLSSDYSDDSPLVYLGLYDDVDVEVQSILKKSGITFNGGGSSFSEVTLEDIGSFDIKNTALFHLYQDRNGVYQLYVLSDSSSRLKGAIQMLLDEGSEEGLEECLITDNTAFCEPEIPATDTPTPKPSNTPKNSTTPEGTETEEPVGTPSPSVPPTPTPSGTASG
ncbi:MAG: DUF4350 domain-containing protein [Anaerolineales bacterium]|jgi:hypothetical protein